MNKKTVGLITLFGGMFLYTIAVQGQQSIDFYMFGVDDNNLLSGTYTFATDGRAQLTGLTGDCAATGLVAAGLTQGFIIFDGDGRIGPQGNVGISIGVTTCTFPNYGLSGTYEVTARDADSFTANGTLTMTFQGRPADCSGTVLVDQPFSLIGNIPEHSFTIQTSGAGEESSYAEAPPPGPSNCTAKIANFITSGTGTQNPGGGRRRRQKATLTESGSPGGDNRRLSKRVWDEIPEAAMVLSVSCSARAILFPARPTFPGF